LLCGLYRGDAPEILGLVGLVDAAKADPSVPVNPARIIKQGGEKVLKAEKHAKVKVSDRWAVVHDGKRYVKDDEVTVPENVAEEWERNGYVERVTAKAAKP
jgi:hypothetical protein